MLMKSATWNKNNTFKFFFSFLKVLHGMDIIHRDLKTKNIMLTADGHCKIGDFGVAKYERFLKIVHEQ